MKKSLRFLFGMFFFLALLFSIPSATKTRTQENETKSTDFSIPEPIRALLDKSCTQCHNSQSDDEAAIKTLLVDELANMKQNKLKTALLEISASVENKMMPPRKFLKKNPEKVLTDNETEQLVDWAENESEKLSGK